MRKGIEAVVELGDEMAVIKRSGRGDSQIAKILGTDKNAKGEVCRVFLDRLVHEFHENYLGSWRAWGAISTVLEK